MRSGPAGRTVILHGLDGSGPGHWQRWLDNELRSREHDVRFPDLPAADDPHPQSWLEVLREEVAAGEGGRLTLVCHSLACLLWLRATATEPPAPVARVLLVAPPWRDDIPAVARFLDHGATPATVSAAADHTALVCSDDDPFCPPGALRQFAEPLALPAALVEGGGHINTDAGYGPWPAVLAWAIGEDAFDFRPQQ